MKLLTKEQILKRYNLTNELLAQMIQDELIKETKGTYTIKDENLSLSCFILSDVTEYPDLLADGCRFSRYSMFSYYLYLLNASEEAKEDACKAFLNDDTFRQQKKLDLVKQKVVDRLKS